MQLMLDTVQSFAKVHNITFSRDPDPRKSKSKFIYMIGKRRNLTKPPPLLLCGHSLTWVERATHLGHELHESGTMDQDAMGKRAKFVENSVEICSFF